MINECTWDYLYEYFEDQNSYEGQSIFRQVRRQYERFNAYLPEDLEQRIISYLRHREDVEDCNDYDNSVRPNRAMSLLMELEPNR